MGQNPRQTSNRRTIFTKDAKLTVLRFSATGAAPADDAGTNKTTLAGYALLWNSLSEDRGGYKVRLLPGSATFTDPTMALFQHNPSAIIGNTQNGTVRITPDQIGVKVEIDLPDTTTGKDVGKLVDTGYVQGMSFAMVDLPKFTMTTEGGQKIMNVSSFVADEVTVTGFPAFADTSIELTGADEADTQDEPEPLPLAASAKKSSKLLNHRDAQGWNVMKYKLDAIGRDSME